jgi:hypothetical protein
MGKYEALVHRAQNVETMADVRDVFTEMLCILIQLDAADKARTQKESTRQAALAFLEQRR